MRILYIWDSDYPWDVRVEKICTSLATNGHSVHIAARNLRRLPQYENLQGLHIHRLKTWKNERINYALSFPAFFSPIWNRFLHSIIRKNRIDLVIVRDLPMAIAGIWAGKRNKIPVIFDMAEDYVAMIWDIWRTRKFQGLNLIVRNPYLARLVERYTFKNADHVLVVIDEAIEVVLKGGVTSDKICVVGNTPPLSLLETSAIKMNEDLNRISNRFSAIYVGGIQMGRGIQTVLEGIPEVVKRIPEFLFVVVGDGYASQRLKNMIKERGLQKHVLWVGWLEHERVYDYVRLSKVGLIPHFVTAHKDTTVPNKLFDYMGLGIPVVATDAVSLKRIITEEKCGIVFRSRDASDLARAIFQIYGTSFDYGGNGKHAVRHKYNWTIDEKRLLERLERTAICERHI